MTLRSLSGIVLCFFVVLFCQSAIGWLRVEQKERTARMSQRLVNVFPLSNSRKNDEIQTPGMAEEGFEWGIGKILGITERRKRQSSALKQVSSAKPTWEPLKKSRNMETLQDYEDQHRKISLCRQELSGAVIGA